MSWAEELRKRAEALTGTAVAVPIKPAAPAPSAVTGIPITVPLPPTPPVQTSVPPLPGRERGASPATTVDAQPELDAAAWVAIAELLATDEFWTEGPRPGPVQLTDLVIVTLPDGRKVASRRDTFDAIVAEHRVWAEEARRRHLAKFKLKDCEHLQTQFYRVGPHAAELCTKCGLNFRGPGKWVAKRELGKRKVEDLPESPWKVKGPVAGFFDGESDVPAKE